jgi:hypothetical protein
MHPFRDELFQASRLPSAAAWSQEDGKRQGLIEKIGCRDNVIDEAETCRFRGISGLVTYLAKLIPARNCSTAQSMPTFALFGVEWPPEKGTGGIENAIGSRLDSKG